MPHFEALILLAGLMFLKGWFKSRINYDDYAFLTVFEIFLLTFFSAYWVMDLAVDVTYSPEMEAFTEWFLSKIGE